MILRLSLCLLIVCALAACGDLPQPFLGNPGATAERLAQPPTPRLAVPSPGNALLSDEASRSFAAAVAQSLQAQAVPAFAQPAKSGDWRLTVTAKAQAGTVVPTFTVLDPKGAAAGKMEGPPVAERVWAAADPATLHTVAKETAPRIASLLTSIQITQEKADPHSLYNRRARVLVAPVTGAPGDGDLSLAKQMRLRLGLLGPELTDEPKDADFTVRGQVRVVPIGHGKERVEIQWHIHNAKGQDLGRVIQLNEIPAGTLDHYWGDVAVVVATEASGGVEDVIQKQLAQPSVQRATLHGQEQGRLLESRRSGVEHPVRE